MMLVNGLVWNDPRFLVVATFKNELGDSWDYYEVFEDYAKAKAKYDETLKNKDIYLSHICVPIHGTDYEECPMSLTPVQEET